jgi:hypothetical protein
MEERDPAARRVCEVQMDVFDTGQNGKCADGKEKVNASGIGSLSSYSAYRLHLCVFPQTTTHNHHKTNNTLLPPPHHRHSHTIKHTTIIISASLPLNMAPKTLKKAKSLAKDLVKKVANVVKPSNEYVFAGSAMNRNVLTNDMQQ